MLIGIGVFLAARGELFNGIWLAVLGWFIAQSARAAVVSTAFTERIDGITVEDIMDAQPVSMPARTPVSQAQDEYFLRYRWDWFPVVDEDGRFIGVVREPRIDQEIAAGRPGARGRRARRDARGRLVARALRQPAGGAARRRGAAHERGADGRRRRRRAARRGDDRPGAARAHARRCRSASPDASCTRHTLASRGRTGYSRDPCPPTTSSSSAPASPGSAPPSPPRTPAPASRS